jgi:hypothetical protein
MHYKRFKSIGHFFQLHILGVEGVWKSFEIGVGQALQSWSHGHVKMHKSKETKNNLCIWNQIGSYICHSNSSKIHNPKLKGVTTSYIIIYSPQATIAIVFMCTKGILWVKCVSNVHGLWEIIDFRGFLM